MEEDSNNDILGDFYRWKNRIKDEPLDLCSVQAWDGWTTFGTTCGVCKKENILLLYEIHCQWGDTSNYEYIRDICKSCLHILNRDFIRNKSVKY